MLNTFSTGSGVGFAGVSTIGGAIPIWLNPEDLQKFTSGFSISNAPLARVLIPGGTPVFCDEVTRTTQICYRFEVYEGASDSATEIKIVKDHTKYGDLAKVGMNIMKMPATLTGTGAAYPITAIDTSNASYDLITLGTTLGVALTAGDVLAEANITHASTAKLKYVANALSYADTLIEDDNLVYSLAGVYFGELYNRRIRKIDAVERAGLTQIKFSELK